MPGKNVYLNGHIVPAADAMISVSDVGFLHGASTFTTMLAHNGKVFRLDRHLSRLMATVEFLSMNTDATMASLADAVEQLLDANELSRARLRITLSPGSIQTGGPTTLVTAEPLPEYPAEWYEKGITVVISSFRQLAGDPSFGHKTGCYLPRIMARSEAAAKGAEEALWFTPENVLAEACFNNVFLVLDGVVCTPSIDTPVLSGIVRETVFELCEKLGIDLDCESVLTVKDMLAAQEIFVTGSTTGIRPVARVERHAVGAEKPGPVTQKLMAAYRDLLDRECPA